MNNHNIPFEYRDEKLVKELERQIDENECGVSNSCFWLFTCHLLGLVCIIPKYSKRKFTQDRLLIELQKPRKPRPNRETAAPPPPSDKATVQ